MESNRRRLLMTILISVLGVGATGYLGWSTSLHEFQGRLVYKPDLIGIPEDTPPPAWLVTIKGTHELDISRSMLDRKLHRQLAEMNGKDVIVRGRWATRRTLSRKHRAIRVHDLRLNALST